MRKLIKTRGLLMIAAISTVVMLACCSESQAQQAAIFEGKHAAGNFASIGEKWMKLIDGNKRLSELSIPGTHDSCALYCDATRGPDATNPGFFVKVFKGSSLLASPCTICQTMTLPEQFKAGIRYIDIRVRPQSDGKLGIYHGIFFQEDTFESVVKQCIKFLEDNPSECIIMQIQNEGTPDPETTPVATLVEKVISNNRKRFHIKDIVPRLGDARGKIVLCDNGISGRGIQAANRVVTENHYKAYDESDPGDFKRMAAANKSQVEGWLSIENKTNHVQWGMTAALKGIKKDKSKMYVTNANAGFPADIIDVAESTNSRVQNMISNPYNGTWGLIWMDFPGPGPVERLIRSNPEIPGYKSYQIIVKTANDAGAGTDSNIFVTLHGSEGSSSEYKLNHLIGGNAFEATHTDAVLVNIGSVGSMTHVSVRSDNQFPLSDWKLESMTIKEGNQLAYFPCNDWFNKKTPSRKLKKGPPPRNYKLSFITGDVGGAGTDSNITVTIHGSKGNTAATVVNNLIGGNAFEKGTQDNVTLTGQKDVGNITGITVKTDNGYPDSAWYLKSVIVDGRTFSCETWLGDDWRKGNKVFSKTLR